MDPRHSKRVYIVQRLFERHFLENSIPAKVLSDDDIVDLTDEFALNFNKEEALLIIDEIDKNLSDIDVIIVKYAPEWPIEQIVKTDLEILRLSIYEGFIKKSVPEKVAINEAIELAREFGGESSRKFVSGVLGSIYEKQL